MGLFSRSKKKAETQKNKRSVLLTVLSNEKITDRGSRISFEIPSELSASFDYKPGQYLNLHCPIDGEVLNRSYSICSGKGEALSVAVKMVDGGIASNWLVNTLKAGDQIEVDFPQGNFGIHPAKKHIAFAAGSGITPILSMAKSLENTDSSMTLFYGNSSQNETFFSGDLNALKNTSTHYYFSRELVDGQPTGRFDKQTVSEIIKSDLSILRADAFYICGPETMIVAIKEVLEVFGIKPEHIHFELFTTPVLLLPTLTDVHQANFSGESTVSAILDGEITTVKLKTDGKSVLDALDATGMDVPFSCKGGVCCTCKAKIIEGSVRMNINYALTDEEVKQGYILTCQSHPTSEVLKIDFDA